MPQDLPEILNRAADTPWVWMAIGTQQTRVVYARAGQAAQQRVLAMGTEQVGNGPFRSAPPTPLALENAIACVEDLVMPILKLLPAGAAFYASAPALIDLLQAGALELEAIEDRFNTLAAYVQGRPVPGDAALVQPQAAAVLLILRETMHHLGFQSVQVV